jgi:hypothetical protein
VMVAASTFVDAPTAIDAKARVRSALFIDTVNHTTILRGWCQILLKIKSTLIRRWPVRRPREAPKHAPHLDSGLLSV